jgi:hypothetical protein
MILKELFHVISSVPQQEAGEIETGMIASANRLPVLESLHRGRRV